MDLQSKLNIAEKNITILIAKLIHQFYLEQVIQEYHNCYSAESYLDIGWCLQYIHFSRHQIAFNYRKNNYNDNEIFKTIRNGQLINTMTGHTLPPRYHYSSGKLFAHGFLG